MSGSGSLSAMSGLAQAAYVEATVAAAAIPAAWPIVAIIYQGQSDPQKIWDAADGWKETIDELEKAQRAIEELARRVGEEKWKGDDRTAFEARMRDYVNQIDFAIVMAWAVAIALWTIAVLIAIFIVLMFVIASLLAIFAAAIVLALATVVGAPEAAALEAEATIFAEGCLGALQAGEKVLEFTFYGAAAVFSGFLVADMIGQYTKGNKDAFVNFGQATVNGLDEMLVGGLNFFEQKLTARMIQGGSGNIFGRRYSLPVNATKGAGVKGLVDTFGGHPTVSGFIPSADSYGSEDGDHDGRPDGQEHVDKTQPHR